MNFYLICAIVGGVFLLVLRMVYGFGEVIGAMRGQIMQYLRDHDADRRDIEEVGDMNFLQIIEKYQNGVRGK